MPKPCSTSTLQSSTSMRICWIVFVKQILFFLSISLSILQASGRSTGNSSFLNPAEKASVSGAPLSLSDSDPSRSLISPNIQISSVANRSLQYGFVQCNGRLYGRPTAASCLDAWRIMPGAENQLTFADRSQEISCDVTLPWRFPSCELLKYCRNTRVYLQLTVDTADARCNIEVVQETMAGRDVARPFDLKMAAFKIYSQCIHGPSPLVCHPIHKSELSRQGTY